MKEDFKIGKIDWFGGWNRKTCRINNFGVIKYGENKEAGEELIKIYHFSDNTKDLNKDDYETLKGKYIISFKENDTRNIFLLENEEVFNNFSIEELQEIILKYINMDLKDNFFIPAISLMLKAIITKEGEFSFLYKDGIINLLEDNYLYKIIAEESFVKYFSLKEEFFLLAYLEEKYIDDKEYFNNKNIVANFLIKKVERKYKEFKESFLLIKNMIPSLMREQNFTTKDLEYYSTSQNQLEVLKNSSIEEVKNYIEKNIKFENCKEIKDFIKYIRHYNFYFKLEELFIEQILEAVRKKLKNSYSLQEYLYYFDGQIIFNDIKNNELYDNLRLELLNSNSKLFILLKKFLLDINLEEKSRSKDREFYYKIEKHFDIFKKYKLFFNRLYYSHVKDEYLKLAFKKNILSIYDFKNGKDNSEVLKFLYVFLFNISKILKIYTYTFIPVPSSSGEEKIGLFNLIKFLALLTGIKNGYGILKTEEICIPKKMKGKGIIGKVKSKRIMTKSAILFDDIWTTGETLQHCEEVLAKANYKINIPYYVTFAKTKRI